MRFVIGDVIQLNGHRTVIDGTRFRNDGEYMLAPHWSNWSGNGYWMAADEVDADATWLTNTNNGAKLDDHAPRAGIEGGHA
jgi:hypothetical protein